MSNFFSNKIEFLKGVGPQKAELLKKELNIHTYRDLIQYYPFRHEDRTKIYTIAELEPDMPNIQLQGQITHFETIGEGFKKRLVAEFRDASGSMDLLWFQGIQWQLKNLKLHLPYLVFGKPQFFSNRYSIVHPEIEVFSSLEQQVGFLQPTYNTTEKLKKKFLNSKAISKIIKTLLEIAPSHIEENLPESLINRFNLCSSKEALIHIHFPKDALHLHRAKARLKFEELFFLQLRLLKQKQYKKTTFKGQVFHKTELLTEFYTQKLPFELTGAQKRVVKEIFKDMSSGRQMNRLLQGDVGSGKTIVAFMAMLIAIDNGAQACLVAPTEILAEQHYQGLKEFADQLGITIDLLTGSTRTKERRVLHSRLENGNLKILIGTHALFEDKVQFENLGLCVIDEQHRFGVEQRSKLWTKNPEVYPHILVMTATPIPRTLAMTLYGDLDVSIIDELPAGRKPIKTAHRYESHRLRVFGFIKEEIQKGRQIYIVYPLIEESEKLDYKNLMEGFESIQRAFPDFYISIVHGQMSSVDKDYEMQRFIKRETHIMVATTVIEVGVNVPNASVMVIENAERFGLAQLHQLRGRVGRGAEQSYCILMTDYKLSKEAKIRIDTMVKTTNGFEIADTDLKLRGPGNLMGTQQSGVIDLVMADLAKDAHILQEARQAAAELIEDDPYLEKPEHTAMKNYLIATGKQENYWSRIS
ncbi:MAG: ATP-dependent DNA helicase RecG [Microscillaceae bacterium]|nr:ATP-dependent DNA helicase RecG [Microscillaceae bacterium]